MPGKQLTYTQKAVALCMIENGKTNREVAEKFSISVRTVQNLRARAKSLKSGELAPKRKEGSGRPQKLSSANLKKMKKAVVKDPFLSARKLKQTSLPALAEDLGNVSVRTIQHRILTDLGFRACRPAKKPLLTPAMKLKRLNFAMAHRHWTKSMWRRVMFSDESSFKTIRTNSKQTVRGLSDRGSVASSRGRL